MTGCTVRLPLCLCIPAALFFSLAAPVRAQDDSGFRLPIELFQGAAVNAPGTIKPYQAGVAILPSWSFDPARLGVKLALDYDDPSWRARFGPRISSRVVSVLRNDIGMILGGEATTTTHGSWRYAANLTFDVDGLIRMGVAGGWEEVHDGTWFVGVTLGADPTRWFSCVKDDFTGQCVGAEDQREAVQAFQRGEWR